MSEEMEDPKVTSKTAERRENAKAMSYKGIVMCQEKETLGR